MGIPKVYLSPSKLGDLETCGYMYARKHIDRWREETVSHALVFGGAVDDALDAYLRSLIAGFPIDPVAQFQALWDARTASQAIAYNTRFDRESLRAMGSLMLTRFPGVWAKTGYQIVFDPHGEPIMQRDLEIELPHQVVLRTKLDLLVRDRQGRILIIDLKTAAAVYPEFLTPLSEQLTAYQIAVEAHAPLLGIERIDGLGFIEMIKRPVPKKKDAEGPTVELPVVAPRRTDDEVAEYLQKVQWAADDVRRGRFPRRPRAGYNTPCGMCFLVNHCSKRDDDGVLKPDVPKLPLLAA